MINTGDKLICIQGNDIYLEGSLYTVGRIINDKHFQLLTGNNADHWYATLNNQGIRVEFNMMKDKQRDAWFDEISEKHIV